MPDHARVLLNGPPPNATPRRALDAFLRNLDPFTLRVILGRPLTKGHVQRWLHLPRDEQRILDRQAATYWRLAVVVPEQLTRERQRRRAQADLAVALYGDVRPRRRRGAPTKTREQMKVAALIPELETAAHRLASAFEVIARTRSEARGVARESVADTLRREYRADEIEAVIRTTSPRNAAVRLIATRHGQSYSSVQTALSRWRHKPIGNPPL